MTYKENVKAMRKEIDRFTRRGNWFQSNECYNKLAEFQNEYLHERSNLLFMEIKLYCELNDIDFKEFCFQFGFDEYYLAKVIQGLIRPSEYFTQRVLKMMKGENYGHIQDYIWR